jgi:hypothetical protein
MRTSRRVGTLDEQQLRQALRSARQAIAFKQAFIDKLTHENAHPQAAEVRRQV